MKARKVLIVTMIIILTASAVSFVEGWGFWGHRRINRMAVFVLPSDLMGFYKNYIEYVTDHAPDPDKRRNVIKEEAPRHYIDVDHYGLHPFDSVPEKWEDAVKKFTEDTLQAYGINPWHIQVMLRRLTIAFQDKNVDKILKISADIGHYIGDAHVPLHTTENYNGQLTNQKGIHGFWESRLPEMYGENYDYFVGKARYFEDPLHETWKIIRASNSSVDSVLQMERDLNKSFPTDLKYSYEQRGGAMMQVYSAEYSAAYNKMLIGMVERRLRAAVIGVASFWYTAWVNAGQPNLNQVMTKEISEQLKQELKEEENLWNTGKQLPNVKGHND